MCSFDGGIVYAECDLLAIAKSVVDDFMTHRKYTD